LPKAWIALGSLLGALSYFGAVIFCGVDARRVAESIAKLSREMRVVAKAAGVSDFAERLARAKQRPAMQKLRSVFQTKRIDGFAAGQTMLSKELLELTQGNPGFDCHLARTKIRIGKALFNYASDTAEHLGRLV
jgi:hypothetical protein